MKNPTLSKSLSLLTHPFIVISILILLINDHLLRPLWPSWWTGKISDFAWLLMAPFAVAASIAAVAPARFRQRDKIIGILAFGITGCVFLLSKIETSFHTWLVTILQQILGIPIRITMDPTDLIALPTLGFGWKLWSSHKFNPRIPLAPGYIALSIVAILTIANMAAPDTGVDCIGIEIDQITAVVNSQEIFVSTDGGISWVEKQDQPIEHCDHVAENLIVDPENQSRSYRFSPGGSIERSLDGGLSWEEIEGREEPTEAEMAYYLKTATGLIAYSRGPFHGTIDPLSGNVIFAMGHEGVLVLQDNGEWVTTNVGKYGLSKFTKLDEPGNIVSLIGGELVGASLFGILLLSTFVLRVNRKWPVIFMIAISWLSFVGSALEFPPAISSRLYYAAIIQIGLYVGTGTLILVSALLSYALGFNYEVQQRMND
jgi:hypothetical protein